MDPVREAVKAAKRARKLELEQRHADYIAGLEFRGFGKIPRLNREIVITEKIDGTNAAIGIAESVDGQPPRVWAQSRTRVISPWDDNYGFAAWVDKNKDTLALYLGPGLHFGEWYGQGINRGYGLTERRFALFNTARWGGLELTKLTRLLPVDVVPVLYQGPWVCAEDGWDDFAPGFFLHILNCSGSRLVPGFMKPEGIMVYHTAGQLMFKATCEGDEQHKGGKRDEHGNVQAG